MLTLNFEQFMKRVNDELWELAGVTAEDLPDFAYREMFDDGESPRSTARCALTEAGW